MVRSPCFYIAISGRTDGSCHMEGQRRVLPSRGQSTQTPGGADLLPSYRQSRQMEGTEVSVPTCILSAQRRGRPEPGGHL